MGRFDDIESPASKAARVADQRKAIAQELAITLAAAIPELESLVRDFVAKATEFQIPTDMGYSVQQVASCDVRLDGQPRSDRLVGWRLLNASYNEDTFREGRPIYFHAMADGRVAYVESMWCKGNAGASYFRIDGYPYPQLWVAMMDTYDTSKLPEWVGPALDRLSVGMREYLEAGQGGAFFGMTNDECRAIVLDACARLQTGSDR